MLGTSLLLAVAIVTAALLTLEGRPIPKRSKQCEKLVKRIHRFDDCKGSKSCVKLVNKYRHHCCPGCIVSWKTNNASAVTFDDTPTTSDTGDWGLFDAPTTPDATFSTEGRDATGTTGEDWALTSTPAEASATDTTTTGDWAFTTFSAAEAFATTTVILGEATDTTTTGDWAFTPSTAEAFAVTTPVLGEATDTTTTGDWAFTTFSAAEAFATTTPILEEAPDTTVDDWAISITSVPYTEPPGSEDTHTAAPSTYNTEFPMTTQE